MKSVTELTPEESKQLQKVYNALREKTRDLPRRDWFADFHKQTGYAHYDFQGFVTPKLIEALGRMPTNDEIIMLVDSGYSHFGAACTLYNDGRFKGYVNFD